MAIVASILIEIVWIGVIVFELWIGVAIVLAPNGISVVEREKRPGIYWFSMTLQLILVIAGPALASTITAAPP